MSRRSALPGSVFADVLPGALNAGSTATNDSGVLRSELMVVDAVSLRCVDGRRVVRSKNILSGSDWTYVLGINASLGIAEEVVKLKTSRDRTILLDPSPNMTTCRVALTEELGVPPVVEIFRPQVTTGAIDYVAGTKPALVVVPDDLDEGGVSMPEPARVVLTAPAATVAFAGAVDDRASLHDMSPYQECGRSVA